MEGYCVYNYARFLFCFRGTFGSSLSFYKILSGKSEKETDRRTKWFNASHREACSEEEVNNACMYSAHFVRIR